MFADLKSFLARSDRAQMAQDALGAVALVVILYAGLHLPGLA